MFIIDQIQDVLDRVQGVRTQEEIALENVERAVVGGPNTSLSGPLGELIWSGSLEKEDFQGMSEFNKEFILLKKSLNNQILDDKAVDEAELSGYVYEVAIEHLVDVIEDENEQILAMESGSTSRSEIEEKTRLYANHLERIELAFKNLESVLKAYNHPRAERRAQKIERIIALIEDEADTMEEIKAQLPSPDPSSAQPQVGDRISNLKERLARDVRKESEIFNSI